MQPTSSEMSTRQTRAVLAVVSLALMTVVSAVSGLNVALPGLARETGATQTEITWIVDAYTVVFAGLLLFAGALGDRFGRKGLLVVGLAIFGAAAGLRDAHQRPRPADRRPGPDGRRSGGDHADHPVGHHDVVPGGRPAEGHRRLGRRGRRRRRPRPVRERHPARVLLLELVLRAQRRPGRAGRCGHPRSRSPLGRRSTRRGSTWSARPLSLVAVAGIVFGIIEGPERGWGDALTVSALVDRPARRRWPSCSGSCAPPSPCSTRDCSACAASAPAP